MYNMYMYVNIMYMYSVYMHVYDVQVLVDVQTMLHFKA